MKNNSYGKGHEFEKNVLKILSYTGPYKITHHNGGSDRGRDIIVNYLIDGVIYDVIVQCKYYTYSVKKDDISSSLDWAKVHRPALLYIWVYPYLTSSTKDYLEMFSKEYSIEIDYEEQTNIEIYLEEIKKENSPIINNLKQRIFSKIEKTIKKGEIEFNEEECYLVDREEIKKILISNTYCAFFVQGISCCGKTQLLKNIAFYYYNLGRDIFWFTFHESDSEIQIKSFWINFSLFFEVKYNDYTLQNYFKTHGYHITSILSKVSLAMLQDYNPIVIIDDIHKHASDNWELRDFFYNIIEKEITIIFFAGWFNIFELTPLIQKKLKNIVLDGLACQYLNQIIRHNTGKENLDIAQKIVTHYNGLPGFAAIVNEKTSVEDFQSDKSFLYSIINYLEYREQEILFVFVHTTIPLFEKLFFDMGYYEELKSLKRKKLIINQNKYYVINDKYRMLLETYPLSEKMAKTIINILFMYKSINAHVLLDISMIYDKIGQYESAIFVLNDNFKFLLHNQPARELLKYFQHIEVTLPLSFDKKQVMLNKAILLENCEEYELCQFYIDILKNSINRQDESWQELFYLEIRCLYFLNKYDDLLIKLQSNNDKLKQFTKEHFIQIFLLIGRVYYIRGFFDEAVFFYLIAYYEALKGNHRVLIVKAIHRIAMVEMKKNLISESYNTFAFLAKLDELVTIKRKSYIFYRLAECQYKLQHYDEATHNNMLSLQLKQSIGHKRGMIFCHRLSAKIALRSCDYMTANCEIQIALDISQKMNLHKEEIACRMVQLKILKEMHIELPSALHDILNHDLLIAQSEKNVYRLHQIEKNVKDIYEDIYLEAINSRIPIELEIRKSFEQSFKVWKIFLTKDNEDMYREISSNNQAISKKLLIQAGLYDPLTDFLK